MTSFVNDEQCLECNMLKCTNYTIEGEIVIGCIVHQPDHDVCKYCQGWTHKCDMNENHRCTTIDQCKRRYGYCLVCFCSNCKTKANGLAYRVHGKLPGKDVCRWCWDSRCSVCNDVTVKTIDFQEELYCQKCFQCKVHGQLNEVEFQRRKCQLCDKEKKIYGKPLMDLWCDTRNERQVGDRVRNMKRKYRQFAGRNMKDKSKALEFARKEFMESNEGKKRFKLNEHEATSTKKEEKSPKTPEYVPTTPTSP